MRHGLRTRVLAGCAAVGLMAAVLVLVGGTAGSGGDDVARDTTTLDRASLDDEARELIDLLSNSRTLTYHAVYVGSSPDVEGSIRLETWQSPPAVRQDSELTVEGSMVRTRTIGTDGEVTRCSQVDGAWTCRRAPADSDPLGPISQAGVNQLAQGSIGARHTTVDGRPVRCFSLRLAQGGSELCATDEGIVVRVDSGGSVIELESIEYEVDDDVFELPAEVT